ncbi:hypothetical protein [Photobacterium ganghwense]|uniref:hypothetical protein n=1 Tax=Photobacterium ganghwense TaxID=320778 RepID=UPI001A8D1AB1|nr:hypothetical protein [Photobacterium ganghwense]QSV17508.1 hypothetical protein FH974_25725 [Photobacterium ganghwense]
MNSKTHYCCCTKCKRPIQVGEQVFTLNYGVGQVVSGSSTKFIELFGHITYCQECSESQADALLKTFHHKD